MRTSKADLFKEFSIAHKVPLDLLRPVMNSVFEYTEACIQSDRLEDINLINFGKFAIYPKKSYDVYNRLVAKEIRTERENKKIEMYENYFKRYPLKEKHKLPRR